MENFIEIKNLYKKYKNAEEFSVNDISLILKKTKSTEFWDQTEPEKQH